MTSSEAAGAAGAAPLSKLAAFLGTWGKPVDRPATWALGIAVAIAVVALLPSRVRDGLGVPAALPRSAEWRRRVVFVMAIGTAFLSLGYVAFYLHAGPRIIDATSYFLEGRVLSHGHLAWTIPTPSASFRGRFLVSHDSPAGEKLSVIFPPGFPLLLAGGFLVGAPLVVGPLLGGLLVIATYWLARELAYDRPDDERQGIAVLAASFSIVCAALRYHTADTMSHGASALGVTVALAAAFHGLRRGTRAPWLLAGLAVGWVACTRPVSALAIGGGVLFLALSFGGRGRERTHLAATLLGIVPGLGFLALAAHAQTGSWLTAAQSLYYTVSDGPPGCFHYGFGAGVGCLEEHGEFVQNRLPHGYGLIEATLVTLRRLRVHLLDVANLEPLALLLVVPLRLAADEGRRRRVTLAIVLGQILAYAPFYFDGDYPGGGARFFADVLPLEHTLLALAVASLLPRVSFFQRAAGALALALVGFAVHGAFEHEALAGREGGKPMYEVESMRAVPKGIVFFDTDHGFDLAYDPYADPMHTVLAARLRNDDHDRLLVERLGHPVTHVYRRDPEGVTLVNWSAKGGGTKDLWHFETEAEWPPFTQKGGWAAPVWASNSCAMDGRVLTLHVAPGAKEAVTTFELPVPRSGKWSVTPRIMRRGGPGKATLRLLRHPKGGAKPIKASEAAKDAKLVWTWGDDDLDIHPGHDVCAELPPLETAKGVELDAAGAVWELTATGGGRVGGSDDAALGALIVDFTGRKCSSPFMIPF